MEINRSADNCHITLRINTSFTYTDSSLETPGFELSAYLKNILADFFFKCSHREQDMSLPAPGQLPASSNCVTPALGSGRNKHLLIPHVPSPLLLCAHTGSEIKHLLISDPLVFINQEKAIAVRNVEQAHIAADMYIQAFRYQIMSPGTN